MLNRDVLLCLLFCPNVFTSIFLWSAVYHLFELGKSKTRIKKEKKTISNFKKIMLIGYAERCKYHISIAKRLCYIYWGYSLTVFVCMVFWILSIIIPEAKEFFSICVLVKVFVLDIPVNIYSFVMTKHSKTGGGSTWVWADKD